MKEFSFCREYKIRGKNFPLLISKLNVRKIAFKNLKYDKKGDLLITVDKKDCDKFLAIVSESWYNIRVKDKGVVSLASYCLKKTGVFLGIAFFIISCYFCSDFVMGIKVKGDGQFFYSEVYSVLEESGVKKYSRFSKLNLKEIGNRLYDSSSLICYAQAKKEGNYLIITVEKSEQAPSTIDVTVKKLVTDVDGVVLDMTVYRGNALKNVGDEVKKGETLVDGTWQTDFGEYSTYVLAKVSVLVTETFEQAYNGKKEEQTLALLKAKTKLGKEEYYSEKVEIINGIIKVELKYVKTFDTAFN